jgi:hypothetical protein
MAFSESDIIQLKERGIDLQTAHKQLLRFASGFPFTNLHAPCTLENGIRPISNDALDLWVEKYSTAELLDVVKFVPASGAATRMFAALYSADKLNENQRNEVLTNLHAFAFYPALKALAKKKKINLSELVVADAQGLFNLIIGEEGLNYGSLPKGLIPFHLSEFGVQTAFEEHLVEAASYCQDVEGYARIHFTVQQEWLDTIRKFLRKAAENTAAFEAEGFELSYSVQSQSTDTIAVDALNQPLRNETGQLVFRPAGHGALLSNLNQMDADLIFIKNIDNVVSDKHKYHTMLYKKAMGGLALTLRDKVHYYCKRIEQGRVPLGIMNEMKDFCEQELLLQVPKLLLGRYHKRDLLEWYFQRFDRPLRVCGMVKNEGEPGGGPFWVEDAEGRLSLQIVESAQINTQNPGQRDILDKSTHFNPVDIVCVIKNYQGDTYDLNAFVDNETGFISRKTHNGAPIKALELPGLWNGSMAHWNTVFVEVPATTFSPVKTINDLLKPLHQ